MKPSPQFEEMEIYISGLQNLICTKIENEDGILFEEQKWKRPGGGGGRTRAIQNGNIFEKGGVNISSIQGEMSGAVAKQLNTEKSDFAACGLSIILHPFSPKIPAVHLNVRYFETEIGNSWFGGGIDLTPYFPYKEDFIHFHTTLKNACESAEKGSYARYKKQCDDYFTVSHRHEMRGIGGVFFDYLPGNDIKYFNLVKMVGNSLIESYLPLVARRKNEKFTPQDKEFQLVRRGRYVEFNLVYDRGTLFGLKTGGRIESILISMPPEVKFPYDYKIAPGTPQFEMMQYYQPNEWCE